MYVPPICAHPELETATWNAPTVSKHVPPEQLGSVRLIVKSASVIASPGVSCTKAVIVYFAPAKSVLLSESEGPLLEPLELVVVSRLKDPASAAAFVATGTVAPLNELQPSALPSSKLKLATTCAFRGAAIRIVRRVIE